MNILICHERFLFRFGADRTLILLGKGMKDRGHSVAIMANRYDADVVHSFASRVIDCPTSGAPYLNLNEFTAEWLRDNWDRLFAGGNAPDAVIVGGWPFFSAITFFREVCQQVIFIDFGVVPTYGYPEPVVVTLSKLRSLRRLHLPDASLIVPISEFIADSQSRIDSANAVPVRSILLAADHMEQEVWPAAQLTDGGQSGSAVSKIRKLREKGKKILLCLGRWEPGCYKHSEAAFEVIEQVRQYEPETVLLLLDEAAKVEVPAHLQELIIPIGSPDDRELSQVMEQVDLGISLSLWEGFNLPLAEMQWLSKPALVLNVGAHPEVVAHPWYLCENTAQISAKAVELLRGNGPQRGVIADSLTKFRAFFRWERYICQFAEILTEPSQTQSSRSRIIVIDVTNSTRDPANSGVIRVTRRFSRVLQENGYDPIFVIWHPATEGYVLPTQAEHEMLRQFNGPSITEVGRFSESFEHRTSVDDILTRLGSDEETWLLLPEVMMEDNFRIARRFARRRNWKLAAIFYDSIPVLRPDLCNEQVRQNHRRYMTGLAECDLAIPISHFSARCLNEFWQEVEVDGLCQVKTDVLPGEFGGAGRTTSLPNQDTSTVRILCVSTLEPRKNHRVLVQACLRMAEQHPQLDWKLILVGNRYMGAFEIADWIKEISTRESRIEWVGIVDDATLDSLYQQASFTVYPSLIEGFGLPIVESIWHGRPCICYNQGVMAELAEAGGCLTTDVTDPVRLGEAIHTLATDHDKRLKLAREATLRPAKTWSDYVTDLIVSINRFSDRKSISSAVVSSLRADPVTKPRAWQDGLYGGCLCENWQMNDSERMALAGLLARHKPFCSIEIGTYHGGSLSLLSQYSELIFSIDIDPSIPSRMAFPNVSFLTGPSTSILPILLGELNSSGTPVEFILIDGDHSAAGVAADIKNLLPYIPKRPLFVLLHDSFNPGCRQGMLNTAWQDSPYCHWVDLDFVPGRIIEHPGPSRGELWGGLAAAYFHPDRRTGTLQISRSADEMFQILSSRRAVGATSHG